MLDTGCVMKVSVFSAASGLKGGQFDRKTDSSVVESDTRCQRSEESKKIGKLEEALGYTLVVFGAFKLYSLPASQCYA
jgi:hypothetical protein